MIADRVLPSREAIEAFGHSLIPSWERHEQEASILEAYVSGRLVDREAIDYEWLCIELSHGIRRISNLPGNEGHCYFTSKPNHLTTCGRFGLVDAALEEAREMAYDEYLKGTVL